MWVCAGSCTLGENVTPSTRRVCTAADHLTRCVSLDTTYVGKIWLYVSWLSQLWQRLWQIKSFSDFRASVFSARQICCTHILAVELCQQWKIPCWLTSGQKKKFRCLDFTKAKELMWSEKNANRFSLKQDRFLQFKNHSILKELWGPLNLLVKNPLMWKCQT